MIIGSSEVETIKIPTYTYTWTVTDTSGAHTFPHTTSTSDVCSVRPPSPPPVSTSVEEWSTDYTYFLTATGSVGTIGATGQQGLVNPKFVVVGVTYAPPGTGSSVTYGNTTSVGNTTTVSDSFTSGTTLTVSTSQNIGVPKGVLANGGVTLTYSSTSAYTQGSTTTNTVTLNKSTAISYKTNGYAYPLTAPVVVSDYDFVWLWLNPLKVMTYLPAVASEAAQIIDQGYAYDPNDPAGTDGPDVYPVQVGYLDGHFPDDPSIDAVLARSWAISENLNWPANEGPGLTPADKANIIALDPFTNPSYNELNNSPVISADGRFTIGFDPPNPIAFVPNLSTTYTTTQSTTKSSSTETTNSFQQAFGVSTQVKTGLFNFLNNTSTTTFKQTFTWKYSTLTSLSTSTGTNESFTIVGPSATPPYTGPGQYIYYQDNWFGTFYFLPN